MAVRHIPWVSPEEFLDSEAVAETKHTYYAGLVVAMAGSWVGHGTACANLIA
jgi:hypothetical protein